jgi:hypothetical protein
MPSENISPALGPPTLSRLIVIAYGLGCCWSIATSIGSLPSLPATVVTVVVASAPPRL